MPRFAVRRDDATAGFFDGAARGEFLLVKDTQTGEVLAQQGLIDVDGILALDEGFLEFIETRFIDPLQGAIEHEAPVGGKLLELRASPLRAELQHLCKACDRGR